MFLMGSEALDIKADCIPQAASALGAGLSYSGGVCGIVTGGLMIIGLVYGRKNHSDDNSTTYRLGKRYQEEFEKLAGSLNCGAISGCDFNREEDRQYFDEKIQDQVCLPLLYRAVSILNEIL